MLKIAQNLASSAELKKREEGLEMALAWIKSSEPHSYLHMMKSWTALFFCMWHSDKPIFQHDLAHKLAKTQLLILDKEEKFNWIKGFWEVICQRWSNIDKWRLDKFLALLRYFINETFCFLQQEEWKIESIKPISEILSQRPLSFDAPKGIIYHLSEIFLEELENILQDNPIYTMDPEALLCILDPFFKLMATADKATTTFVNRAVFGGLLGRWSEFFDSESSPTSNSAFEQRQEYVHNLIKKISEKLFSLATSLNISATNRTALYNCRIPYTTALNSYGPPKKRKPENDENPSNPQKRKLEDGSSQEIHKEELESNPDENETQISNTETENSPEDIPKQEKIEITNKVLPRKKVAAKRKAKKTSKNQKNVTTDTPKGVTQPNIPETQAPIPEEKPKETSALPEEKPAQPEPQNPATSQNPSPQTNKRNKKKSVKKQSPQNSTTASPKQNTLQSESQNPSPQITPSDKQNLKNPPTPSELDESGKKKKVTFNLEQNSSVDYEQMEIDANTPHRPGAKPKTGILKASPVQPQVKVRNPRNKNGRGGTKKNQPRKKF